MFRRLAVTALVAGLALATPTVANAWPPSVTHNIANGGASAVAPENTLAAVRAAVHHSRPDEVKIPVRRTKDNQLVVVRDATLARTTDAEQVFPDRAPWQVSDFTLAEIKRLVAKALTDGGEYWLRRSRVEKSSPRSPTTPRPSAFRTSSRRRSTCSPRTRLACGSRCDSSTT